MTLEALVPSTRYFYDTEFHDTGTRIDLISIGVVCEDGREYYAVSSEFNVGAVLAHDWLPRNVWPHLPAKAVPMGPGIRGIRVQLDTDHPDVRPRKQIATELRDFLYVGGVPELWAWFAAYDHVALTQIWGRMVGDTPAGIPMYTHDLWDYLQEHGISITREGARQTLTDPVDRTNLGESGGFMVEQAVTP